MKLNLPLFAGVVLASCLSLSLRAAPEQAPEKLGTEKTVHEFVNIEVKNYEDEILGHIKDLGIDLVNGRIVEVLVVSDDFLDVGGRVVAVPPLALIPDGANQVYRLNVSVEDFKAAPAIKLREWADAGRSERVAAAYHYFGRQPYFLENGEVASKTAKRPKVALGYVERSSKILEMPVGNFKGQQFGKVWSLTMDIPKGRILSAIIVAPGNFQTKSVVPAMSLSFNEARTALLLDDSKTEFADEPHYVFTEAAYGNEATSKEESYEGPHTSDALEQGKSYFDIDRTLVINRGIRAAKINNRHVQVGTIDGRVTLRGWVVTADEQRRIGEIAIAASRVEVVDNQITVGKPVANN